MRLFQTLALVVALIGWQPAIAQGTQIQFGNAKQDTTQPVEISADKLDLNQKEGTALFVGNVVISQGEMRLSAPRVEAEFVIENGQSTGKIARVHASGGVTLVNGDQAAEGREADYTIEDGIIIMTGDVVLTQGQNALAAERMTVRLEEGTANLEGRVRSILQPSSGAKSK